VIRHRCLPRFLSSNSFISSKKKGKFHKQSKKVNTYVYMNNLHFSQDQLVQVAKLSDADIALIDECRGEQNKLGLGYQLGFVRCSISFPHKCLRANRGFSNLHEPSA